MSAREFAEIEERLREWGTFFRDRHRWGRTGSIEGLYEPHSKDFVDAGELDNVLPDQPLEVQLAPAFGVACLLGEERLGKPSALDQAVERRLLRGPRHVAHHSFTETG